MQRIELNQKLMNLKREKTKTNFSEETLRADPFEQFIAWFSLALQFESADPSAMILATVDENGFPDARIVLLKELAEPGFIFYSSYDSKKAKDLSHQPVAALNFYWPDLLYQVRIRGRVEKLPREKSEDYFATRPREAQLSAQAWVQSSVLSSRTELENKIKQTDEKYSRQAIPCPENWGGYLLLPFEYEFFQRREWRWHDRFFYRQVKNQWEMIRLAP
jgi:pyridoxamine 5'-phosphate oxidase